MKNDSEPTRPLPEGQLLQILVANEAERGGLMYSAKWFKNLDERQKYEVAELCDRILRTISPTYRKNVEKVDEAARIGFALQAKPPLNRMVLTLLSLRSWKDADHDDSAPTD